MAGAAPGAAPRPWMYPAHPPFPTASNFLFHLSAGGSQSSMLMRESGDGLRTATTRQCAGAMIGAGGVAPRAAAGAAGDPGAATGWKTPSGTNSAFVMVVYGNEMAFNPSHGVGGNTAAITANVKVSITTHLL